MAEMYIHSSKKVAAERMNHLALFNFTTLISLLFLSIGITLIAIFPLSIPLTERKFF